MSRVYKLRIPVDLTNLHIKENKINIDINMLNILDTSSMSEILKKVVLNLKNELSESISQIDQTGKILEIKTDNGMIYNIDLEKLILSIDLSESFKNIDTNIYEESLTENLRQLAKNEIITIDDIDILDDKSKKVIQENTNLINSEIEKKLVTETFRARQFINQILKEVYKEAIKEKASQMGNINSIKESDENGEYRVKMIIT